MKRTFTAIILFLLAFTNLWGQRFYHELGGELSLSLMNSDYGEVPGMGAELRHGLNFRDGRFVIKSNIGLSSFTRSVVTGFRIADSRTKSQDYLFKIGTALEYNLKSTKKTHTKDVFFWTPYFSAGPELIYRSTAAWANNEASSGFYPIIKSALGVKFQIGAFTFLNIEGSYNWDFYDQLDSYEVPGSAFDNFSTLSVGIMYYLGNKKVNKWRSPWSGI